MKLSLPQISKIFYANFDATIDGHHRLELLNLKSKTMGKKIFYQPDFMEVNSISETDVKLQRFHILFPPKFHCRLNPIKQCWEYAKRLYQLQEPSSNESMPQKSVDQCLNSSYHDEMVRLFFINKSTGLYTN
jgi:hypothetical protein